MGARRRELEHARERVQASAAGSRRYQGAWAHSARAQPTCCSTPAPHLEQRLGHGRLSLHATTLTNPHPPPP